MGHHGIGVPDDVVQEAGGHLVDGGQGVEAPPGGVLVGPGVEIVPVEVGRFGGIVGAGLIEGAVLVKIAAVGTGVGIDAVENDLDAPDMGGGAEGLEVGIGTQHGVGLLVIAGVVAMGGEGHADGVQVEDIGAQGGDVVHLLGDTLEVAAVEVVVEHNALGGGLPVDFFVPVFVDDVGFQLAFQVGFAHLVEAVGEDLIDQAALGPFGHGEVGGDAAQLPGVAGLHVGVGAFLEEAEAALALMDKEIIEIKARFGHGESALIDLVGTLLHLVGQGHIEGVIAVFVVEDALNAGGAYGGRDVDVDGTDFLGGNGAEGGLVLGLLAVVKNPHVS